MTTSGPTVPPVPPPSPAQILPRGDSRATILSATGQLQNLPRPAQIAGQVVQDNPDGSVVIRTDQGDVTAKIRSPQPLAEGQQVQIDLQPGNPPRQAVIRAAPDQPSPAQASTTTTDQTAQAQPQARTQDAPPRQAAAPAGPRIDVTALPPAPEEPATAAAAPLRPNQPVRLLPLTPRTMVLDAPPAAMLLKTPAPPPPGTPLQANAASSPLYPATDPATAQTAPAAAPAETPAATPDAPSLLRPSVPDPPASNPPPSNPTIANIPASNTFMTVAPQPDRPGPDVFVEGRGGPAPAPSQHTPLQETLPNAPATLLSSLAEKIGGKLSAFLHSAPAQEQAAPAQSAPAPSPLRPAQLNTPFDALVKAVLPPGTPPPASTPGQIAATVIGFTEHGLPVLSLPATAAAPAQTLVLQFPAANLTTGVQITLAPQNPAAPSGLPPLALDTPGWPALQALDTALSQMSPQAAQILAQILPNAATPQQIPPAAILFMAALQGGDLSSWLGNKTVDLLRRAGRNDLISRLGDDMDTAQNASTQNVAQDWKALPLPLYYEGQIDKAMLWFRQDGGDEKDGDDKKKQTRFVLDLNLNRMGAVQFDGLARPQRIDLIVRTMKPVSEPMRKYMRQRYLNALDRVEHSGELSFQDRAEQFVKIDARKTGYGLKI